MPLDILEVIEDLESYNYEYGDTIWCAIQYLKEYSDLLQELDEQNNK